MRRANVLPTQIDALTVETQENTWGTRKAQHQKNESQSNNTNIRQPIPLFRWLGECLCLFYLLLTTGSSHATTLLDKPNFALQIQGTISTFVRDDAGRLYVGGSFDYVNGHFLSNLARLNTNGTVDTTWTPNPDGPVNTLAIQGSNLYVGGSFSTIGTQTRTNLAKISTNGSGVADSQWIPNPNSIVQTLILDTEGYLYVGGFFWTIAQQSLPYLAKLSTSGVGAPENSWRPGPSAPVMSLLLDSNHNLFVGGFFSTISNQSHPYLAKLSSTGTGLADPNWTPTPNGYIETMLLDGSGQLYVAGGFSTIGGQALPALARISDSGTGAADPTWWAPRPVGQIYTMQLNGTDLYVGGSFTQISGLYRQSLAKLSTNGIGEADATWDAELTEGGIAALLPDSAGNLYVGGSFKEIQGEKTIGLARISNQGQLDTQFISAIGARLQPHYSDKTITGTARQSDGRIILGGDFFTYSSGKILRYLIRINTDGSLDESWTPDPNQAITALTIDNTNHLYACGDFTIISGTTRTTIVKLSLPSGAVDPTWIPKTNGPFTAIAFDGAEHVVVARLPGYDNKIRQITTGGVGVEDRSWNSDLDYINALVIDHEHNIFAGGTWGITKIDGATHQVDTNFMSALYSLEIHALEVDGSGSLYLGGSFYNIAGSTRYNIAKVSTTTGTLDPYWAPQINDKVYILALDGSGHLYAGGDFSMVGDQPRQRLAKIQTTGNGVLDPGWAPIANGRVEQIVVDGLGSAYLLGEFTAISGTPRGGLAAVTTETCYGDNLLLQDKNYNSGTTTCTATTAITTAGNTTIQSGATLQLHAPTIRLEPGFHAITGSHLNVSQ